MIAKGYTVEDMLEQVAELEILSDELGDLFEPTPDDLLIIIDNFRRSVDAWLGLQGSLHRAEMKLKEIGK